jgi:Cu/Ag efflux protein CusF
MSMQKSLSLALALVGAALAPLTLADTTTPVAGAATLTELSGEVVAIDPTTRLMTLKTADGTFEVMRLPEEVKRIDQIKLGNTVTITETEAVLVDIEKGKDAGSMGAVPEKTVERDTTAGGKPAGTMTDKLTLYGKVEAVDKADSKVTVRGPNRTVTLKVRDRAILDDLAPGDGVIVTYLRTITGKVEF